MFFIDVDYFIFGKKGKEVDRERGKKKSVIL
jgi:hypothetical protein